MSRENKSFGGESRLRLAPTPTVPGGCRDHPGGRAAQPAASPWWRPAGCGGAGPDPGAGGRGLGFGRRSHPGPDSAPFTDRGTEGRDRAPTSHGRPDSLNPTCARQRQHPRCPATSHRGCCAWCLRFPQPVTAGGDQPTADPPSTGRPAPAQPSPAPAMPPPLTRRRSQERPPGMGLAGGWCLVRSLVPSRPATGLARCPTSGPTTRLQAGRPALTRPRTPVQPGSQ